MDKRKLDAGRVSEIVRDCLYRDDEIVDGEPAVPPVLTEGVVAKLGLHPERLAGHRAEIVAMLDCLPDEFKMSKGGGWSFLNACTDRDGELWTGDHLMVDELLCLGIAVGAAKILLPRDLWTALPGGVPYFAVLEAK